MATVRETRPESINILDLPTELIEHICCYDVLSTTDIYNLAISHPKLNDRLFRESNSCLWKSKYIQKYGQLDNDEFKIIIDEKNTWKHEIMLRMTLDRVVPHEINQMPDKYMTFKSIPYHLYPLSEYLNSESQSPRYYVLSACAKYYNYLLKRECSREEYKQLFMAQNFLIYSCQVYFSYKLNDFLNLPPTEQIVEQGFYLLGRWWCPSIDTPYQVISKNLYNIAVKVCNHIRTIKQTHPLFKNENYLNQMIERGKTNLDHDLFDETNTIIILDSLRQVVFSDNEMMCECNNNLSCFILQEVINCNRGSVFMLCVLYESLARRLGVKVRLTATSVHNFVSWSSSWPENKYKKPTCYLIDIASGGVMREATICPVSKKLPEHYNGNSIPDLFWAFSKAIEQLKTDNIKFFKYVLDFQKILRPDDTEVEFKYERFHLCYDYCPCPLIRTSLNPHAPNHVDEKPFLIDNENSEMIDFDDISF